jgi:hypothetical protein
MSYIGNNLQVAYPSYRVIDDISSGFNGVLKTFALTVAGSTPIPFPINPQQCLLSVNNIVQKPDSTGASGFTLTGSNIVFATAPTAGWSFFGTVLAGADYVNVGANFPSGTAAVPSVTFDASTGTGLFLASSNVLGIATSGVQQLTVDSSGNVSVTGVISSALGTAAAPAYRFTGDPNTGLYSPGADQVAISTNGTGRLFVDAAGNVGVGVVPTGGEKLTVNGLVGVESNLIARGPIELMNGNFFYIYNTGSSNYWDLQNNAGALAFRFNGGEKLRIDTSGRVGIGTTSPDGNLTIGGLTNTGGQSVDAINVNRTDGVRLFGVKWDVTSNEVRFSGNTKNYVFRNGSSEAETARIDSSGRLLVGTSTASTVATAGDARLQILGNNAGNAGIITLSRSVTAVNTAVLGQIVFADNVGRFAQIDAECDGTPGTNDYPGRLTFFTTADGAASPTERMRITSAGNVGINVTPVTKLDLSGNYSQNITAVSALDLDLSTSNFFTKTINANSTFTVSNTPAGRAFSFTLELTHTSGTITWFSGVEWPGGTAPTLSTGKTHLFMFVTDDGGTRWRGASLINYTT